MMFDFEQAISWYLGHLSKQRTFNGHGLLMLPSNGPHVQNSEFSLNSTLYSIWTLWEPQIHKWKKKDSFSDKIRQKLAKNITENSN